MGDNTAELNKIHLTLKEIARGMQPSLYKVNGEQNEEVVAAIKASSDKDEALSKEEKKLWKELQNSMNLKKEFGDLTDVMKLRGEKTQYAKFVNKLGEMSKERYTNLAEFESALEDLEAAAKAAGTTLKKEGVEAFKPLTNLNQKESRVIKDGINLSEKKQKQIQEEIDLIDEKLAEQARMREEFDKSKASLIKWGGVIKTIAKDFVKFAEQEQRFAQASATADAGWIDGITQMGISQIEYMKILKGTRQESMAASTAGVNFKESLAASATSLHGLTANYEEAAKGAMQFHKNMARVGVSQDDLGDAVDQQKTMYEKNYRAMGYTVEEFNNLTNELINDQGMRSTLLGLQESERKAYILSVQQRQAEYLTMGYTIERAKELQKTFQALNKMSPKERMKQAAKQRAMMGAMGMGGEGEELFRLQTQYRTMGPQEKAAAEKRMAEINAMGAKKFGEMSGSGASMGQAMSMQMMADKTGFTQVADTFETETGQGLKFDKKQLDATNEISGTAKAILGAMDYWGAASQSSIGSIATNIGSVLIDALGAFLGGKMLLKGAAKMAGMGGGGGMLSGAIQGVKGVGTKMAGMAASGAGMVGTGVAKGAGMLGAAGGLAGKAAKGLGKGAAKTALKAIPGIGLIAALGFMGSRIADGDFVGAGMELAAGGMGLLPGLGTAGSIGMSGAIVARDLARAAGPEEVVPEVEEEAPTKKLSQETILAELNTTLMSIHEYLLTTTEANTEQAESLNKTAKALSDNQRIFAIPDGRAGA